MGPAACGALEPVERAQLDRHLVGCAHCRDELLALQRVVARLSALMLDEEPSGGTAELRSVSAAEPAVRQGEPN